MTGLVLHIRTMTNNDNSHPHFHRKSLNVEFHFKFTVTSVCKVELLSKNIENAARTVLIVLQVKVSYHNNSYYMT